MARDMKIRILVDKILASKAGERAYPAREDEEVVVSWCGAMQEMPCGGVGSKLRPGGSGGFVEGCRLC